MQKNVCPAPNTSVLFFNMEGVTFIFRTHLRTSEEQQVMKFNKSKYRSFITDDHLSAVLCIVTSEIQPDFNVPIEAQDRLD